MKTGDKTGGVVGALTVKENDEIMLVFHGRPRWCVRASKPSRADRTRRWKLINLDASTGNCRPVAPVTVKGAVRRRKLWSVWLIPYWSDNVVARAIAKRRDYGGSTPLWISKGEWTRVLMVSSALATRKESCVQPQHSKCSGTRLAGLLRQLKSHANFLFVLLRQHSAHVNPESFDDVWVARKNRSRVSDSGLTGKTGEASHRWCPSLTQGRCRTSLNCSRVRSLDHLVLDAVGLFRASRSMRTRLRRRPERLRQSGVEGIAEIVRRAWRGGVHEIDVRAAVWPAPPHRSFACQGHRINQRSGGEEADRLSVWLS